MHRPASTSSAPAVHVVGVGTIGAPLIRLLLRHRAELGLGEVSFHKRGAHPAERPALEALVRAGARLCASSSSRAEHRALGLEPAADVEDALAAADAVVDCTPAALEQRERYRRLERPRVFVAQGSEHGFGKPYAWGVNDAAVDPAEDRWLQVMSCNTHGLASLIQALSGDAPAAVRRARFVCLRRANDVGKEGGQVASPSPTLPTSARFGTHHARDVHALFATRSLDLDVRSAAIKLPTQYMHAFQFELELSDPIAREDALARLAANPRVALTRRRSASEVFAFAREHGFSGRLLNHAVVAGDTVATHGPWVTGFGYTPQDGNTLLSSAAAVVRAVHPQDAPARLACLRPYLFAEV